MTPITRRTFIGLAATATALLLAGCSQSPGAGSAPASDESASTPNEDGSQNQNMTTESGEAMEHKALVVFFSCTGNTEQVANHAAEIMDASTFRIVPQEPYTESDLAYYTNGRADREQADQGARPAMVEAPGDIDGFDTILLGHPIWHGQAPRIVSTFLESCDLAGKTIVTFCTSHSSGIGSSASDLHALQPNAHWLEGRRFASGASKAEVEAWLQDIGLASNRAAAALPAGFSLLSRTVQLNDGCVMPTNGLGTYSLRGSTCVDSVKSALDSGVRLIDTAYMYGNEAEVGQAVRESGVPREDVFVITKLYPSQFANARQAIEEALAKMDIGYVDMMLLHHPGTGDVEAYKAMEEYRAAGKIRSLGLSCYYVDELGEFLPQVSVKPALVQNEMHPYYQDSDVVSFIHDQGIALQAWYPLGGRGHNAELLSDPVLASIASAHGVSIPQVILRWNLQRGVVVIPGSSNPAHIEEDDDIYGFELSAGEMRKIAELEREEKHDWY